MDCTSHVSEELVDKLDELKNLIPVLDKLHKSGNLPGVGAKLLKNYELIRSIATQIPSFNAMNGWINRVEDEVAGKKAALEEFEKQHPLYEYLQDCGRFYGAWCGTKAIGHWCGVPVGTEQDLFNMHRAMKERHPLFHQKGLL